MNIVRPRAFLVVALSVMIFTSTAAVLDSLEKAPTTFAAEQGWVISSPGAPTIFSSSVDEGLAGALNGRDQMGRYLYSSAEIFAFSSYNGIPFVVRGANITALTSVGPQFTTLVRPDGGFNLTGNEALIGSSLRERLGVDPPCQITLTGSYESRFAVVSVVGWFESQSPLDDEILVTLDVARWLSGMAPGKVSIVRVPQLSERVGLFTAAGPRFAIYGFSVSDTRVAVGGTVNASVTVSNWGSERGSVIVTFSLVHDLFGGAGRDRVLVGEQAVELDPGEKRVVTEPILLGLRWLGELVEITVEIPSEVDIFPFETDHSLAVEVVAPYVRVVVQSDIVLGSFFNATVTDSSNKPLDGAEVSFLNQTVHSGADGNCTLFAGSPGVHSVNATFYGLVWGSHEVNVVDISTYLDQFNPVVSMFEVVPNSFKESADAMAWYVVENKGLRAGNFTGYILLDDTSVIAQVNLSLGPAETKTGHSLLGPVPVGDHSLTLYDRRDSFTVNPWYSDDSDLVLLLIRYGGKTEVSYSTSIPIVQAAKISEGDIQVALVSIGAVSGALAALSTTSIFAKEIHESRKKLGVLRTIGASRLSIRWMTVKQSLLISIPAACAGVVLGLLAASVLLRSGGLMMFGHTLLFEVDSSMAPPILIGTVLICLASSLATAEVAARATPISSIRRFEDESVPPVAVDELLGEE